MIVFKLCVGNAMYRINRHIQPSSCLQHLYVHKQAIPKKVGLNFKQKLKTHSPSDGGAINKRKGASKTQFSVLSEMWGSGDLGRSRLSLDCVHWADKTPTADARACKNQLQAPAEWGYFHLRRKKQERDDEAVRLLNERPDSRVQPKWLCLVSCCFN